NESAAEEVKISNEDKTDNTIKYLESSRSHQRDDVMNRIQEGTNNAAFLNPQEHHSDIADEMVVYSSEEKSIEEINKSNVMEGEDKAENSKTSDKSQGNFGTANDPVYDGNDNVRASDTGTDTGFIPGLPQVSLPTGGQQIAQGNIPGLGSTSNGPTPTLFIGGFSILMMPMPGMSDMMTGLAQNMLPLLQGQGLPAAGSLPNLAQG
ncbi:hypothetical protein L9F63_006781, partial [Diploptera punctata]